MAVGLTEIVNALQNGVKAVNAVATAISDFFTTNALTWTAKQTFNGGLSIGSGGTYTIASGVITITSPGWITVDTEAAGATDDLDTINGDGNSGNILVVSSVSSARDTTLKDNTGNLLLAGDFVLTNVADRITLLSNGTTWVEIARSDNA